MTKQDLYNTAIEAKEKGEGKKIIAFYEGMGFINRSEDDSLYTDGIVCKYYGVTDNYIYYYNYYSTTGIKILDFSIMLQNVNEKVNCDSENDTPKHYDNSKGTLYKVAMERGWNPYLFDIVKRLERSDKKGEFKEDLRKSKVVIDLWEKETNNNNR